MKKIFGFLMITVLLWSCGSQFTRSKYDRYMWNRSNGETKDEANTDAAELKIVEVKNANDASQETETTLGVLTNVDENSLGFTSTSTYVSPLEFHVQEERAGFHSDLEEIQSVNELPKEKNDVKKKVFKNRLKTYLSNHAKNSSPTNGLDGDGMFILLLILTVILPPLAVYLKDSGITGLFWVTLILCLVSGGGFIGIGILYSGWFIAFLLALLRVLDVI